MESPCKSKVYKNVKCSLKSILINPRAGQAIENRCLSISRMAVRASKFCELMIESLLEKERGGEERTTTDFEWPDFKNLNTFRHLFTIGTNSKITNPIPAVEETWKKYKDVLNSNIKRFDYDDNLITYSSRTFQTAFENNLRLNFKSRQRKAIGEELRLSSSAICKPTIYALQCFINGWDYKGRKYSVSELDELRQKHRDWINKHRQHLPVLREKGEISEDDLSLKEIILYNNFLKTEYGERNAKLKNIKLVPQNRIKVHYVDFDADGVKGLLKDLECKVKNTASINQEAKTELEEQLRTEGWHLVFNVEKILKMGGTSTWIFDGCVATDGVDCSVRYFRWKTESDNEVIEEEERRQRC